MGARLAPSYANIFMGELEKRMLQSQTTAQSATIVSAQHQR